MFVFSFIFLGLVDCRILKFIHYYYKSL